MNKPFQISLLFVLVVIAATLWVADNRLTSIARSLETMASPPNEAPMK